MNLALVGNGGFHHRILRQIVLPRVVDVAFRERIDPSLAAFQVALIILIKTVALSRDAGRVGLSFRKLGFQHIDIVRCRHQVGL
ncbi:hypothetical protein D3C87_1764990 [compost metagenome]